MSAMPLPRFAECEYSVFISYSGGDTLFYGGWTQHFAEVLNSHLKAALSPHSERIGRSSLPEAHAFELTGIVAGSLAEELRRRISASHAMVIVVGEAYADSDWCLKEIGYFRERFGAEGLEKRLYVVVLNPEALQKLRQRDEWRSTFREDPVWVPFFDKDAIGQPWIPVLRSDGKGPEAEFLKRLAPIRERMVAAIVKDIGRGQEIPPTPLLIGACVEELDAEVQVFVEAIRKRGREATVLRRRQDMEAWIKASQQLVLPFNLAAPLTAAEPGGHLAQQLAIWRKFNKPEDQLFALDLSHVAGPEPAEPRHLDFLKQLDGAKHRTEALLDILCPPERDPESDHPPATKAQIWIESTPKEPNHWKALRSELETRWRIVLRQNGIENGNFPLMYLGINIAHMMEFPIDDADGLILLWGNRDPKTLFAKISQVERRLSTNAPGIIAYLSPPNAKVSEALPALGWEVLRFTPGPPEPPPPTVVAPEPDDEDRLAAFLNDVYRRASGRAGPATATATVH